MKTGRVRTIEGGIVGYVGYRKKDPSEISVVWCDSLECHKDPLGAEGGIHFRKLTLRLSCEEDLFLAGALVAQCSQTLESLNIACKLSGTSIRHCIYTDALILFLAEQSSTPVDLSKAAGLKNMAFQIRSESVNWITMALQTITPRRRDLLQVTIDIPTRPVLVAIGGIHGRGLGETISRQWLNLDHHLVQLWESRSIYLRVGCARFGEEQHTEDVIGRLLPEVTKRGAADPLYLEEPYTITFS